MNDILGIGKILPLDKLVVEVSKGVGRLTKSYFDKKDIDTEAYRIRTLASANMDALKLISNKNEPELGLQSFKTDGGNLKIAAAPIPRIGDLPDVDIIKRTEDRALFREVKKQQNLEAITAIASEQLKDEPEVDNTPVDETWLNRFINTAEEISEEELQNMWGRILAGEIKSPNTYSLRTLDVVRNISKAEALLITKMADYSFQLLGVRYMFHNPDILRKHGVDYYIDIPKLTEIGITQANPLSISWADYEKNFKFILLSGSYAFQIERTEKGKISNIPVIGLTTAGSEIFNLLTPNPKLEFLKDVLAYLKDGGVVVNYAKVLKNHGERISHSGFTPLYD